MRVKLSFLLHGIGIGMHYTVSLTHKVQGISRLDILRNNRFMKRVERREEMDGFRNVAKLLGVTPPWNAPAFLWNFAWKFHQFMIPWLHAFDKSFTKDSSYNLPILWCKAISGNRWGSKLWDGHVSFDLLPPVFRWIVQFPLSWLYPNLHHQNVAMRTVFLDEALSREIYSTDQDEHGLLAPSVQVITLGAGYDPRSLRYLFNNSNAHIPVDFFEIDLPAVAKSRMAMLERFLSRRKQPPSSGVMPQTFGADLNNLDQVRDALAAIASVRSGRGSGPYRKTIFLIEAVWMYLQAEKVSPLIDLCVQFGIAHTARPDNVVLCFADRFPGICKEASDEPWEATAEKERAAAAEFLGRSRLELTSWLPKLGRARHMGVARVADTSNLTSIA